MATRTRLTGGEVVVGEVSRRVKFDIHFEGKLFLDLELLRGAASVIRSPGGFSFPLSVPPLFSQTSHRDAPDHRRRPAFSGCSSSFARARGKLFRPIIGLFATGDAS